MSKKVRLAFTTVPTLLLLVLVAVAAISFSNVSHRTHAAAPSGGMNPIQRTGQTNATLPVKAAFSAFITNGIAYQTKLVGGMVGNLTLDASKAYIYKGTYYPTVGSQLRVYAKFTLNASDEYNVDVIFYASDNAVVLHGTGGVYITEANENYNEYAGKFELFSGNSSNKRLGSGGFSFLFVNSSTNTSGSFEAKTKSGTDIGRFYFGALSMDTATMSGKLILYDGSFIPFTAYVRNHYAVTFTFSIGTGPHETVPLVAKGVTTTTGYQGTFRGPASSDAGTWDSATLRLS